MKILIIEDENAAARRLEKLLAEVAPEAVVLQRLDSVETSVLWLQSNPQPDLILLDIHLADGSSFEIFDHVTVTCPIIFTTAYDEFALQAFKVNAVDYLLKPIKTNELIASLDKYKRVFKSAAQDYSALLDTLRKQEGQNYLRRMLIRFGNSIKLMDMADAAYFYTKDKITFLVSRSTGKRFPVDYPLDKLEGMLDPAAFFRINRQFIINVAAIKEMHPYSKSRVKVELEPSTDLETIVSTERSAEFKKWLVGEQV
ncbi:MAG: DNA-binding response regulator [Haliscomenobacteraceae bacterium CHB4]|nr:Sensory transduction protein LytR [Saprospiraceae bacterium]MCE7922618.1 DNA-binding response regulator [Haliscomenobacteraceae bacterium CHB4]